MKATMGLAGFFQLSVFGPDGELRRKTGKFQNLITNNGLNAIGSGAANVFGYAISVGTGTTPPTNSDTQLDSFLAYSFTAGPNGANSSNQTSAPYFAEYSVEKEFAPGQATGNISEVGFHHSTSGASNGTNLYSRSLVKDGAGNPTTITVLADETLRVTYFHRMYPPVNDVTGTFDLNGTTHSYTLRAANVTSAGSWSATSVRAQLVGTTSPSTEIQFYGGSIGDVTSQPSGFLDDSSTSENDAYVTDSFERVGYVVASLPDAVDVDITAIRFTWNMLATFQMGVSPPLRKTDMEELKIGIKLTWARASI